MNNVLYFVNYPFRMTGANQVLFNLLQSRKDRSIVIFLFHGPVVDHFETSGIKVYSLNYKPKWIGSFGKQIFKIKWYQVLTEFLPEICTLSYKLFQLLRREKIGSRYRIIHFNDTRGLLTAGWFFRLIRCKIVTHIHGEFDASNVKGMRWKLARFLSHQFITVSSYLRESLDEKAKAKTVNIYNGLNDSGALEGVSYLKKLQKQKLRIFLKVASLVPFKGIHVLVDAVRLLSAEARSKCLFVIAGPEPEEYREYQNFVRAQISRYELHEYFLFVGWQNDLSGFYDSCDVLVHSSMSKGVVRYDHRTIEFKGNEGLPTCILEAMRASRPVIASRISGIPEQVVNDYNGVLVEPGNAKDLANAIAYFIEQPQESLHECGLNSRTLFLERFQLSGFVSAIESVYAGFGK